MGQREQRTREQRETTNLKSKDNASHQKRQRFKEPLWPKTEIGKEPRIKSWGWGVASREQKQKN